MQNFRKIQNSYVISYRFPRIFGRGAPVLSPHSFFLNCSGLSWVLSNIPNAHPVLKWRDTVSNKHLNWIKNSRFVCICVHFVHFMYIFTICSLFFKQMTLMCFYYINFFNRYFYNVFNNLEAVIEPNYVTELCI